MTRNNVLVAILALSIIFHVIFYYYMGFQIFSNASTAQSQPDLIMPSYPPHPSHPHHPPQSDTTPQTNNEPPSSSTTLPPIPSPYTPTSSGKFVSQYDYKKLKLPDGFHQCIEEEEKLNSVPGKMSPLVSIVVTSSLDHVNVHGSEFDMAAANLRCYTQLHGYNYFTNLISNENVQESNHFFGKRWQTLYDRYINHPASKWVFQVDADTIVANLSKPMHNLLDTPAEVIMNVRRNLEVSAAMVGFRASSPFARCFLKRWVSYGASKANWDNGDLLQLILDIVDPDLANKCRSKRGNYRGFIACFAGATPKFKDLDKIMPIKIYLPFSGLWRSLECWLGPDKDPNLFRHCVDDDLLVHGWKDIGSKHITPAIYKCDANNPELYGPLKKCHWKTPNETLDFAKKCCYEAYTGCTQGEQNICTKDNAACKIRNGVPEGYYTCKYQHMDCPNIPYP